MAGPEPAALPLGDIPILSNYIKKNHTFQGFFESFLLTKLTISDIIKLFKLLLRTFQED
nr:MAG TPA: hypothetical protein [Caudoviricetes sp.]